MRANSATGSLTVVYDGSAACRKAVMRALERFSQAPVEGEVPHPVMVPTSRKPSAESLAKRVANIGLEQAISNITERAIQIAAAALPDPVVPDQQAYLDCSLAEDLASSFGPTVASASECVTWTLEAAERLRERVSHEGHPPRALARSVPLPRGGTAEQCMLVLRRPT